MRKTRFFTTIALVLLISMFCGSAGFAFKISAGDSATVTLFCDVTYPIFEADEDIEYTLSWTGATGGIGSVTATNYFGEVCFTQSVEVGAAEGSVQVVLSNSENRLDIGHYTVTAQVGSVTVTHYLAVVPNLEDRLNTDDSPVAFSAMASHAAAASWKNRDKYVETIALAGVKYIRDYVMLDEVYRDLQENGFAETNPKISDYYYNELLDAYDKYGIDVMMMFQGTPDWAKATNRYLPADLSNTYKFVKELCEAWGDKIDAIELMNEPDLTLSRYEGPEQYAAAAKAAAIAAKKTKPDLKISVSGYSAHLTELDEMRNRVLQSELADYYDIHDLHFYQRYNRNNASTFGELATVIPNESRSFIQNDLINSGLSDKQVWLSEFGVHIDGYSEGEQMTLKEMKVQGQHTPEAFLNAMAEGYERIFWFIHAYYEEKSGTDSYVQFGTFTNKGEPTVTYSAIAALTAALGNAQYSGKNTDDGVNKYFFEDSALGDTVGCFWSGKEQDLTLNITGGTPTVTDIMGKAIPVTVTDNSFTIPVSNDVVYVRVTGGGFDNISAAEAEKLEKTARLVSFDTEDRVVLRPLFTDEEAADAENDGAYSFSPSSESKIELEIYNFNNANVTVSNIAAENKAGWTATPDKTSVTVPAMGKETVVFTLDGGGTSFFAKPSSLVFSAAVDGKAVSDCVCKIKRSSPSGSGTYETAIRTTNVAYNEGVLSAQFSDSPKAVKYIVDNMLYDATAVSGNSSSLNVWLGSGTHDVYTIAYGFDNRPYAAYNQISSQGNTGAYVVSYKANNGAGAPSNQSVQGGIFVASTTKPRREGYLFLGWATDPMAADAEYLPGREYTISSDLKLYAVWGVTEAADFEYTTESLYNPTTKNMVVKGNVGDKNAGYDVTVIVTADQPDATDITKDCLRYVGQSVADLNGNYVFEFDVLPYTMDDPDTVYYVFANAAGEWIDGEVSAAIEYQWIDANIKATVDNGKLLIDVTSKTFSGEAPRCSLIVAWYKNDMLRKIESIDYSQIGGEEVTGGIKSSITKTIPDGAEEARVYLWSSAESENPLIPICIPAPPIVTNGK